MGFYGGLQKESVLEIYNFAMRQRKETGYGQRKIYCLIKKKFGVEIKESTISGWIFRKVVPFANEKTQFKAKPVPPRDNLYQEYIVKKQSAQKLAQKYNVSTIIAINWLKSYGIPVRSHIESMNTSLIKEELRRKKLRRPTKNYRRLTPEKAYILGVLCGDGHITKTFLGLEIRYDEDFIKEFTECFERIYGLTYNYRYYKSKNTLCVRISNQLICEDLMRYGKFGTENWNIPKEIMETNNKRIIGAFIRGFYDSEGSVSRPSITASSINKNGLVQIQILLEKLGIKTTLCPVKGGKYHVLHIFRKERFKRFEDRVGFTIKRKSDKLHNVLTTGFFTKRSVADN